MAAPPPPPPPPFRPSSPMNVGISTPPPPARALPPDPHSLSPQAPPPRKYPNSNDLDRSASVSPSPISMPPMPSSPLPPPPIPGSPSQPPMPSGALPPLPSVPLPALPQVDIPDENTTPSDSDTHSEPATPTNMPAAPSSDALTQGILPPDDPIYQNRFTFISDLPPVPHWTSIPKHYVQGNPHPICPEIPGLSHSFHSSASLSPTNASRIRSSSDSYIQAQTNKEFDQPTRITRGSVGANMQSNKTTTFCSGGGGARPLGSAPHRSPPAVPRSMFPLTVNTIPSPSSATTSTSTSTSVPSPQASPTNTNASSPAAAPAPASSPPAIPKKPALLPKPHIAPYGTLTLSPTGTPQIPAKPVMSPKPNLPAKPSASAASPSASPSSGAISSIPLAPPMGNNTPPGGSPQIPPPRRALPPTPST